MNDAGRMGWYVGAMLDLLTSWILALMTFMAPHTPWQATYPATAAVLASTSIEKPLFEGRLGPLKTATLLVSLGWFEASLRPDAEGDCIDKAGKGVASKGGRCPEGSTPQSFCLFQVEKTNFAGLGVTREEIQNDVSVCMRAAHAMIKKSFSNCKGRPIEDRLAWYAAGPAAGPECNLKGVSESKNRMAKASWLLKTQAPSQELADLFTGAP